MPRDSVGDPTVEMSGSYRSDSGGAALSADSGARIQGSRSSSKASFSKTSSADAFTNIVPEALSFENLLKALELLKRANLLLELESDIFEDKLTREAPDLLSGTVTGVTFGHAASSEASLLRLKMSASRRADLAVEAARLAAERAQKVRQESAAAYTSVRAHIEEMNARLQETRLSLHQLEQEVIGQGADMLTGRAAAEKFVRFMTDWIKIAEATVGRLRLKTSSLRAVRKRIRMDVATKRELGEALRPVDFDKIRIEIHELGKKIESKNMHLIDLKNISGSATARLLVAKKKLGDFSCQLQDIRKEAATKRAQITTLEGEEHKVLEDVARADVALNAIRLQMERYTAPDLLDYVRVKDELDGLRKAVVVWARRCKIQQQTVRHLRRGMSARTPALDKDVKPASHDLMGSTSDMSSSSGSPSFRPGAERRRERRKRRDSSTSQQSSTSLSTS